MPSTVRMKFQTKLTLLFLTKLLFTVVILSCSYYVISMNILKEQIFTDFTNMVSEKAKECEGFINLYYDNAMLCASRRLPRGYLDALITKDDQIEIHKKNTMLTIHDAQRSQKDIRLIDIVTLEGRVIASTIPERIETSVSENPFFKELKDHPVFSDLYKEEHAIVFDAWVPLVSAQAGNTSIVGALHIEYSAQQLLASFFEYYEGVAGAFEVVVGVLKDNEIAITNRDSYQKSQIGDIRIPLQSSRAIPMQLALQGKNGIIIADDYNGIRVLAAYHYVPSVHWGLVIKVPYSYLMSPLRKLLITTVIITVPILFLAFFLTIYISRKALYPLRELSEIATRIRDRDFNVHAEVVSQDEFGVLARAMNLMVESLQKSYRALEEWGKTLEVKVKERTEDLQASNEELEVTNEELRQTNEELETMTEELQTSNEEAIRAKEAAEAATIAKGDFLANISHELRTPMSTMLGFTELLSTTPVSEKQGEYLATIRESGDMLLKLVDELLDMSKIEAGELTLEHIDFNLRYLVESAVKSIQPVLLKKEEKVAIVCEYSPTLPEQFKGDPTRVRQIVGNLLSNAGKFTKRGEIKVSVSGEKMSYDREKVIMKVSDTGIGIPYEKQKMIFDAFAQVDTSTTRKFGGTGLGLTIVRNLCGLMGGEVTVESQEGTGSTFVATIVLASARQTTKVADDVTHMHVLKGKKVAILDDHKPSRDILENYLLSAGMDVVYVSGRVSETVEWLKQGKTVCDFLFVDVVMPEMNGCDFVSLIHNNNLVKTMKLCAVTADVKKGIESTAKDVGFHAYIPKPIVRAKLLSTLISLLENAQGGLSMFCAPVSLEALAGCRVLVVEDHAMNLKLICEIFETMGIVADAAHDGAEAVQKVESNEYDIILMDVHMPVLDGFQATTMIRTRLRKHTPIVALTAAGMETDKKHAVDAGMNDYLVKPISMEQLVEVLKKWCARTK